MTKQLPLIQFDQVGVSIHGKAILAGISFDMNAGDKAVFRGKSGAGKSTVLKTLLGLYPLARGTVHFQGKPLDKSVIAEIRRCAAYIGQEPVLGAETVRDALLLPFQFKAHSGNKPSETTMIKALRTLHLPETILSQDCSRVSGGEKQRIALARGLLLGKSLYLLDEVTSALDVESKQAVFDVFADPKLTVLSVAHDSDWVALCGRVFDLEGGNITEEKRNGDA
ncbi:MAG: ABC transporter ATP-binding protein [Candidatus Methylumidiphilus alinenensis]|uniref:ABC transporter ATP-binding protein n=1 Tax=Candidatus Methylumidiphilus alinenensis TaxID=2202197 RepID=A0A2W4QF02_9GAMM|nr:MAG: ABC transporter ATP-binding protein [Candidatus Methylumidiphilus alinenensis]